MSPQYLADDVTEVAFVCLGHSTMSHSDTLFSCALEIFLSTYLLTIEDADNELLYKFTLKDFIESESS